MKLDKVTAFLVRYPTMFLGYGTVSGGAHVVGQNSDRSSFQLVSAPKLFYCPSQCRTSIDVLGRSQRDRKPENAAKAKRDRFPATMHNHLAISYLSEQATASFQP
jgi:hypothetical protein